MKIDVKQRTNGTLRVTISWHELQQLILHSAISQACGKGRVKSIDAQKMKVTINQQSEGSPSYNVQKWEAVISGEVEVFDPTEVGEFAYCDGCSGHECSPEKGCAYPMQDVTAKPEPLSDEC